MYAEMISETFNRTNALQLLDLFIDWLHKWISKILAIAEVSFGISTIPLFTFALAEIYGLENTKDILQVYVLRRENEFISLCHKLSQYIPFSFQYWRDFKLY